MNFCSEQKLSCHQCPSFKLGVFSGLSVRAMEQLEAHKTLKQYKKKDIIYAEGEPLRGLFCIKSGKVNLFKTASSGKRQILKIARPGDLLGHSSMFTHSPYLTSAEALEDCAVCFWDRDGFLSIMQTNTSVTFKVMAQLSAELNRSEHQVLDLAYRSVRGRLADFLLTLMKKFAVHEKGAYRLAIDLSRQELAQAIGSTEETIVRLLSEFREDGFIKVDRKSIAILDPVKLAGYTEGAY